jgi:hypothetical protein
MCPTFPATQLQDLKDSSVKNGANRS